MMISLFLNKIRLPSLIKSPLPFLKTLITFMPFLSTLVTFESVFSFKVIIIISPFILWPLISFSILIISWLRPLSLIISILIPLISSLILIWSSLIIILVFSSSYKCLTSIRLVNFLSHSSSFNKALYTSSNVILSNFFS